MKLTKEDDDFLTKAIKGEVTPTPGSAGEKAMDLLKEAQANASMHRQKVANLRATLRNAEIAAAAAEGELEMAGKFVVVTLGSQSAEVVPRD